MDAAHRARQLKRVAPSSSSVTSANRICRPDRAASGRVPAAMNAGRYRYSKWSRRAGGRGGLTEKYRPRAAVTAENILASGNADGALCGDVRACRDGRRPCRRDPYTRPMKASSGPRGPIRYSYRWTRKRLPHAGGGSGKGGHARMPRAAPQYAAQPTGAVLTAEEIAAIGEVARRHDLLDRLRRGL